MLPSLWGCRKYMAGSSKIIPALKRGQSSGFRLFLCFWAGLQGISGELEFCFNLIKSLSVSICLVYECSL